MKMFDSIEAPLSNLSLRRQRPSLYCLA